MSESLGVGSCALKQVFFLPGCFVTAGLRSFLKVSELASDKLCLVICLVHSAWVLHVMKSPTISL